MQVTEESNGDEGGFKSCVLAIEGKGVYSLMKVTACMYLFDLHMHLPGICWFVSDWRRVCFRVQFEAGVHRVQRVPATEAQGRVHTSTATVAVMPEVDEVTVVIDPKDITMTT